MFYSILILACLGFVCHANVDFQSEFNQFKTKHNKIYAHPKEEAYRFQVFSSNLKKINEHNEKFDKGLETYDMGINEFTDLTFAEFSQKFLGFNASLRGPAPLIHNRNATNDLPETLDWRESGIIGEIKNQGDCGSCWAFSATSAVESAWAQAKGQLVSLSEQNLMDCSYTQGNSGCSGGLPYKAFNYIIENGGIDTEESYPYVGTTSKVCSYSADNVGATISSFVDVESGDESALKNAVAERVVSVAIHVGETFQNYKSGIFDMSFCPGWSLFLNHAVVVIGWGTDHWLIKNSWGDSWGENGFAKFAIDKNLCGIANAATYPLV